MKRYVVREVLFEVVGSKGVDDKTPCSLCRCPGVTYEQMTLAPVAIGLTLYSGATTIQPFKVRNWIGANGIVFQEFDSHDLKDVVFEGDER